MLQPDFCEMMLSEVNNNPSSCIYSLLCTYLNALLMCCFLVNQVENFSKWVNETKLRIIRPNTMTNYGAVLDDFGLDSMLDQLIEGFILPLSKGKAIYD